VPLLLLLLVVKLWVLAGRKENNKQMEGKSGEDDGKCQRLLEAPRGMSMSTHSKYQYIYQ
jgi:cytochrome c-type biogenesis protein CcmH/NrfF